MLGLWGCTCLANFSLVFGCNMMGGFSGLEMFLFLKHFSKIVVLIFSGFVGFTYLDVGLKVLARSHFVVEHKT